jgi:Ca-activated chloride channel family protein
MDERIPNAVPIRTCRPDIVRSHSDVRVELADRVLKYDVEERFVNRGAAVGEADYLFPLPNNAAFQDLKLSINGELVAGETMSADTARRIYETIVRTQRDPALVEWMGHGLLRARIFPLNPGEEKTVVVRFQSVVPREGDALRIDYFRGVGQNASMSRDVGATSFTLSYRPSNDLGQPYSPTHSLDIADHDGMRVTTVRGDARDVTLLVPLRRSGAAAVSMLPYAPGNEDGFALFTITPPVLARGEVTPRDITLVIDVSGSMQGRKIEQARAAGRQLLSTLRPEDHFRLIDFSSDVRTFRDDYLPATAGNLREAMHYLDALEAQGGTNIEGALREALRPSVTSGRLPLVLFVTDGEPTVGEQRADRLAAIGGEGASQGSAQRRIFTFGLGSDVNVSLLEQLALGGRGTADFVRPDESVERVVGIVAKRLVDPVLTDVRVRVDGDVRLSRMLPTQASDAFADRDLIVLARYSGHGRAHVTVEGSRRGAPVRWTTDVDFPDRERQNPFVARLWATQRVGYLSAEKRRTGGSSEVDEEIRMLGERYGIPTEFTSYLVTEPQFNRVSLVRSSNGAPVPLAAPAIGGAAESKRLAEAPRDARFESAKVASAQRAMSTISVADSLATATAGRDAARSVRRVDVRTFLLRDSVWTDQRYRSEVPTITIKPFSKAYFDLLNAIPELRPVFALGPRVIIAGRDRAIALSDRGQETMTAAQLAALAKAW